MVVQAVAYLAGPDVFLPNASEVARTKVAICRSRGLDARHPALEGLHVDAYGRRPTALQIFDKCIATMRECSLVIANVTPFRGVSMDVGTAVEIGYMYALGRPVFGYTTVAQDYEERVGSDGYGVDAYGLADNPMCIGPAIRSGGVVVREVTDPPGQLGDLHGFIVCVEKVMELLREREAPVITAEGGVPAARAGWL